MTSKLGFDAKYVHIVHSSIFVKKLFCGIRPFRKLVSILKTHSSIFKELGKHSLQ